MSSPTRRTRTEGSFHGSSQYAAAEDVQYTAMSVAGVPATSEKVAEATAASAPGGRAMMGSTAMVSPKSPNATFQGNNRDGVHVLCRSYYDAFSPQ